MGREKKIFNKLDGAIIRMPVVGHESYTLQTCGGFLESLPLTLIYEVEKDGEVKKDTLFFGKKGMVRIDKNTGKIEPPMNPLIKKFFSNEYISNGLMFKDEDVYSEPILREYDQSWIKKVILIKKLGITVYFAYEFAESKYCARVVYVVNNNDELLVKIYFEDIIDIFVSNDYLYFYRDKLYEIGWDIILKIPEIGKEITYDDSNFLLLLEENFANRYEIIEDKKISKIMENYGEDKEYYYWDFDKDRAYLIFVGDRFFSLFNSFDEENSDYGDEFFKSQPVCAVYELKSGQTEYFPFIPISPLNIEYEIELYKNSPEDYQKLRKIAEKNGKTILFTDKFFFSTKMARDFYIESYKLKDI